MNGSKRRGKEEWWGVGERDEQAHPILIPGQAGVHSCRSSHSRAWIWLRKSSINQLILQEAAYSGAAVRNALSRVCAGVPQPCTRACSTRVRVPHLSVHRARLAVHKHQTSSPAPREGGVCGGEGEHRSCAAGKSIWHSPQSFGTHPGLTRARWVQTKGVHKVQAGFRNCSPSFPLKAAEQDPSPHSGDTELQTKLWNRERIAEIGMGVKDDIGSGGGPHATGGGLGTGEPGCIARCEPRNLSCTERWEGVGVCVTWGSWDGGGGRRLCWGMREFLVSPTSPHPPSESPHIPSLLGPKKRSLTASLM